MMKRWMPIALLAAVAACPCAATTVDVAPYVKNDDFGAIKLSPNGDYYAASVPQEGKSVLLIVHRSDNKPTGAFNIGKNSYVGDFYWVSPTRLVISTGRKFGALDKPEGTGDLYAINADGSDFMLLVGPDVHQMSLGTHIQGRETEQVAAGLVDDLPNDDQHVLVSVSPFDADAFSRVDRMDVETGVRRPVVKAPVRNASFMTDHHGVVRFASGRDMSNVYRLYYRADEMSEWSELNNEVASGHAEWPLGFSADDRTAFLQVGQATGPDAIVAMDSASRARKQLFRDVDSDPGAILYAVGDVPVGAMIMGPKPRTIFFDTAATDARLYRSLEAAFPGNTVAITSQTTDGHLVLVSVSSDRNPGDFYVFDTMAKKAEHLVSRRDWFDPTAMSEVRPFNFKARDGMSLFGYLTMPRGAGKNLPMVVLPHGGPFGISDEWAFDPETQLLAATGYAVLQINYRGSSGHGQAYQRAGKRQWGAAIQDDITDATRWAVSQGIADAQRICIYGGSFGGYASLMGVAKERALYKCAIGYAGVYDLPMMFSKGDVMQSYSGKSYMQDWIGEPAQLGKVSPANLASQIKVPVLLVAGGQDERAPIEQSEKMEKALRKAGVPVDTLFIRTEGHGFFVEEHKQQFYNRLLGFLDKNIGGGAATAAASAMPATAGTVATPTQH
jgi:dipeptidyl aminopeptidase/acylaminoacyl peptidase